jgi:hypothetical protein
MEVGVRYLLHLCTLGLLLWMVPALSLLLSWHFVGYYA